MKGSKIIEIIKNNRLEDFSMFVSFVDGYNIFPNVITIPIVGLSDIGTPNVNLLGGNADDSPLNGFQLIKMIVEENLESNELLLNCSLDSDSKSPSELIEIMELGDIGHSDKVAHFQGKDR